MEDHHRHHHHCYHHQHWCHHHTRTVVPNPLASARGVKWRSLSWKDVRRQRAFLLFYIALLFIIIIINTWPKLAYGWQGLAGRIVGPRYISSGSILGCSQRLASHLRPSARIGCLTRGPNWSSWGTDDYWCLPGAPTDLLEEVKDTMLHTDKQTDRLIDKLLRKQG